LVTFCEISKNKERTLFAMEIAPFSRPFIILCLFVPMSSTPARQGIKIATPRERVFPPPQKDPKTNKYKWDENTIAAIRTIVSENPRAKPSDVALKLAWNRAALPSTFFQKVWEQKKVVEAQAREATKPDQIKGT
jgi:hypothetical protein